MLDKVQMPDYLIGGIKQRDFRLHAQHHCNSEILIQEDIHNFFPSITMDQVKRIWTDLFKFGDEVAALLTKLTVYRGSLPQGAKTSVGLANLVLFQYEAQFYEWCKKRQLSYTRYIDDISISSHRKITTDEKTIIINKLYGMLLKAGFKPQRSKHQCSTASQRMEIMGMVVNRGKPTLTQEYRRNVRALIHTLHMTSRGRLNKQTPQFLSAMGKINHLGRYHPKEAERLKEKLLECCNNKCTTVV